jgi:hypothetical protein
VTIGSISALAAMLCFCSSSLSAQEPGTPPSSIIVRTTSFASWNDDVHLLSPGSSIAVPADSAVAWWGLGRGATVGAAAALGVTQAFCTGSDGCVGRTIGAILMGSLLGGALETGMEY